MKGKASRILSRFWTKQPNMYGPSANALKLSKMKLLCISAVRENFLEFWGFEMDFLAWINSDRRH